MNIETRKLYTILPYVIVDQPFKFGEFTIWPDTKDNWKKYLDISRPNILKIYVDRKGKEIPNKTIITTKGTFSYEKLRQLLACLFFIPSQRHWFRFSADSFFNETFQEALDNANRGSHSREDKFVTSLVMNKEYKIYQPVDADLVKFELRGTELEDFKKLEKIFRQAKKINILRSLSVYFKTQSRNQFWFPEIEDIQNFCTAFEILFNIDVANDIGEEISKKLFKHFSLAEKSDREELKKWFVGFYKVRSLYTHGNEIDPEKLVFNRQRQIDVAKQIYCEAINKFLKPRRGPGRIILSSDKSLLVSLFSSQKIYDELIDNLTKSKGKEPSGKNNLKYLINCSLEDLDIVRGLFYKFILYANKKVIKAKSKRKLKDSMQTVLSAIDYLIDEYDKPKYKKEFYIEALQEIRKANLFPKTDQELENTYNFFRNPNFKYNELIGDLNHFETVKFRREVVFRDLIDISLFVNVYENLYLSYRDWH